VIDLEASARAHGALCRRRCLRTAADLLRLCLSYAVGDLSLRLAGQWATLAGVGTLSDVAVLQRLRRARPWLAALVAALLLASTPDGAGRPLASRTGRRAVLRLVDGTVLMAPGSGGVAWRGHATLDLATLRLADVELTDQHGGESLARHPWQPGEVAIGDRGFCRTGGLRTVLQAGADVVVRLLPSSVRLETEEVGARLDLVAWLATGPTTSLRERPVWLVSPHERHPLRLLAGALPPVQADAARRTLRQQARRHGRTPSHASLVTAGWVLLLTSLPQDAWPAADLLVLYRCRWQVELLFKRLKSLWRLDGLRARDPDLAQSYLLAKFLAILLTEHALAPAQPMLDAWTIDPEHPLSLWRWTQTCVTLVTAAILGPRTLPELLDAVPRLRRFLCSPPRRRPCQSAVAPRLATHRAA